MSIQTAKPKQERRRGVVHRPDPKRKADPRLMAYNKHIKRAQASVSKGGRGTRTVKRHSVLVACADAHDFALHERA
jgi:hypothetical protein